MSTTGDVRHRPSSSTYTPIILSAEPDPAEFTVPPPSLDLGDPQSVQARVLYSLGQIGNTFLHSGRDPFDPLSETNPEDREEESVRKAIDDFRSTYSSFYRSVADSQNLPFLPPEFAPLADQAVVIFQEARQSHFQAFFDFEDSYREAEEGYRFLSNCFLFMGAYLELAQMGDPVGQEFAWIELERLFSK